jgi:hypothetical protein
MGWIPMDFQVGLPSICWMSGQAEGQKFKSDPWWKKSFFENGKRKYIV